MEVIEEKIDVRSENVQSMDKRAMNLFRFKPNAKMN
jgi:hypothetical protein